MIAYARSNQIRRVLFLEPVPTQHCARKIKAEWRGKESAVLRWGLKDAFMKAQSINCFQFRLNPIFEHRQRDRDLYGATALLEFHIRMSLHWRRLLNFPPGRWQEMLVSQPPCIAVDIPCIMPYNTAYPIKINVENQCGGVRLGEVVEALRSGIQKRRASAERHKKLLAEARRGKGAPVRSVETYVDDGVSWCKLWFSIPPSCDELIRG